VLCRTRGGHNIPVRRGERSHAFRHVPAVVSACLISGPMPCVLSSSVHESPHERTVVVPI
jgi:hypothetical protein